MAFSTAVSGLVIMNFSPETLNVVCQVLDETSFYHDAQRTHVFHFPPFKASDGDEPIYIKNLYSDTLALDCYQQEFPQNSFDYRAKDDEENASTKGKFIYQSYYPGALIFEAWIK